MNRSIIISSTLHVFVIFLTAMSLPFLAKKPVDLPPIVSVELIQITEKTNIPFAPKAKKIIEKIKEKEKKLVSEQAPPKKVKKIKPDAVPMPDDKVKKVEKIIAKVLAVSKNRTDTRIYVRGDKTINYGRVLEIMGLLSGSGFTKVALISEPYKER